MPSIFLPPVAPLACAVVLSDRCYRRYVPGVLIDTSKNILLTQAALNSSFAKDHLHHVPLGLLPHEHGPILSEEEKKELSKHIPHAHSATSSYLVYGGIAAAAIGLGVGLYFYFGRGHAAAPKRK